MPDSPKRHTGYLPRLSDVVAASLLLVTLAPLCLLRALAAKLKTGRILVGEERIGRHREPFTLWRFAGTGPGMDWPVLFNIWRGDLSFAGPRPLTRTEADALPPEFAARFALRPGLISPFALRRQVGIAYENEAQVDHDFYYGDSRRGHLGLIVRFIIGYVLTGKAARPIPPSLNFFGVTIANTTVADTLDWIVERVQSAQPALIAFVNPDSLNIAYRHAAFHRVLNSAARVLPDGIGIHLGCRMLGVALRENVNGTDLFPRLCERAAAEGLRLYLLGARPGVAAAAADHMRQRYPALNIVGTHDGYFPEEQTAAVVADINASEADILLVAFGAPKQELWLDAHAAQLAPSVRLGVGGLFDFYSGRIPRAPLWMREIGLEWTWRLIQEPGRMWRRYLIGNPLFLLRVWRQKLSGNPT